MKTFAIAQRLPSAILAVFFLVATTFTASADYKKDPLTAPVPTILEHYVKIQESLSKDSLRGVDKNAAAMAELVRNTDGKAIGWAFAYGAEKLAKAENVKAAREQFKLLSDALVIYLAENNVKNADLTEFFCPRTESAWLQKGDEPHNPYLGKSGVECGKARREF